MSFCDVQLYCLVIHMYEKPYNEVISWSRFHTVVSLLPVSLPTNVISAAKVLISLLCVAKVCSALTDDTAQS